MIIELTVGNYRSLRDLTELSMVAATIPRSISVISSKDRIDLLKTAAIYGANGSGKSTLISAIAAATEIIDGDLNAVVDSNSQEPFYFEVVIDLPNGIYGYGFEIDTIAGGTIVSEWLSDLTDSDRHVDIFTRSGNDLVHIDPEVSCTPQRLLLNTDPNLTAMLVKKWFDRLDIVTDISSAHYTLNTKYAISKYPDTVDRILKTLDLHIDLNDIKIHRLSTGELKIYRLAGLLATAIHTNGILVIDDLDANLHPIVASGIIDLACQHNCQLLFTAHDPHLLDKLDCDSIWFQDTHQLVSLAEYQVGSHLYLPRAYLHGRFGAVPFVRSDLFNIQVTS